MRSYAPVGWKVKESERANLRRMVKRGLRNDVSPPDLQEKAARTALQQAELLASNWADDD